VCPQVGDELSRSESYAEAALPPLFTLEYEEALLEGLEGLQVGGLVLGGGGGEGEGLCKGCSGRRGGGLSRDNEEEWREGVSSASLCRLHGCMAGEEGGGDKST